MVEVGDTKLKRLSYVGNVMFALLQYSPVIWFHTWVKTRHFRNYHRSRPRSLTFARCQQPTVAPAPPERGHCCATSSDPANDPVTLTVSAMLRRPASETCSRGCQCEEGMHCRREGESDRWRVERSSYVGASFTGRSNTLSLRFVHMSDASRKLTSCGGGGAMTLKREWPGRPA